MNQVALLPARSDHRPDAEFSRRFATLSRRVNRTGSPAAASSGRRYRAPAPGSWTSDSPRPRSPRCCRDRKSTRLNSSHDQISYAVFCLKKKKKKYLNFYLKKKKKKSNKNIQKRI